MEKSQLYMDPQGSGLGDENITITGDSLTVEKDAIDLLTTGVVTASIVTDEIVDSLATLTGTNNSYTITIADVDATGSTAEELNAIDAATTVTIDAGEITGIEGTYDQIVALYESPGVSGLDNENISITDEITVTQANAIDLLTTGVVTASIVTTETVDSLKTLTGTNAYTIVISDTTASASDLNAINGLTTEAIDATNVTGLTYDTITNINTLLIAGNDPDQFTNTSFSKLDSVSVFDSTQYLIANSDLAGAFGNDTNAAYNHYVQNGLSEGRNDGSLDITVLNNAIAQANKSTAEAAVIAADAAAAAQATADAAARKQKQKQKKLQQQMQQEQHKQKQMKQ